MKTTVATMRRTLSILAGQGDGAGSKIDMDLPLSLAEWVVVSEVPYLTTRSLRWVTPGDSMILVLASSIRSRPVLSNNR